MNGIDPDRWRRARARDDIARRRHTIRHAARTLGRPMHSWQINYAAALLPTTTGRPPLLPAIAMTISPREMDHLRTLRLRSLDRHRAALHIRDRY